MVFRLNCYYVGLLTFTPGPSRTSPSARDIVLASSDSDSAASQPAQSSSGSSSPTSISVDEDAQEVSLHDLDARDLDVPGPSRPPKKSFQDTIGSHDSKMDSENDSSPQKGFPLVRVSSPVLGMTTANNRMGSSPRKCLPPIRKRGPTFRVRCYSDPPDLVDEPYPRLVANPAAECHSWKFPGSRDYFRPLGSTLHSMESCKINLFSELRRKNLTLGCRPHSQRYLRRYLYGQNYVQIDANTDVTSLCLPLRGTPEETKQVSRLFRTQVNRLDQRKMAIKETIRTSFSSTLCLGDHQVRDMIQELLGEFLDVLAPSTPQLDDE